MTYCRDKSLCTTFRAWSHSKLHRGYQQANKQGFAFQLPRAIGLLSDVIASSLSQPGLSFLGCNFISWGHPKLLECCVGAGIIARLKCFFAGRYTSSSKNSNKINDVVFTCTQGSVMGPRPESTRLHVHPLVIFPNSRHLTVLIKAALGTLLHASPKFSYLCWDLTHCTKKRHRIYNPSKVLRYFWWGLRGSQGGWKALSKSKLVLCISIIRFIRYALD